MALGFNRDGAKATALSSAPRERGLSLCQSQIHLALRPSWGIHAPSGEGQVYTAIILEKRKKSRLRFLPEERPFTP